MAGVDKFAHGYHYGDYSGVVWFGPPTDGFWLDRLAVSDCYIGPLFRGILDRAWRGAGGGGGPGVGAARDTVGGGGGCRGWRPTGTRWRGGRQAAGRSRSRPTTRSSSPRRSPSSAPPTWP